MPGKKRVEVKATKMVASPGDEVVLKPNVPDELNYLANKVGKWQSQVGEYSHIHFQGHGTVSIKSSYLIVM